MQNRNQPHNSRQCYRTKKSVRDQKIPCAADRDHRLVEHKIHRFEYSLEHQKRSEEHTSELQSRRDLVCRLLLEKKKKKKKKKKKQKNKHTINTKEYRIK